MHSEDHNAHRVTHDLSHGWTFLRRRVRRRWLGGDGAGGDAQVDLPHCWNTTDTFEPGTSYYQGDGAYRRTFEFRHDHAEALTWHLRADGFYGIGDVWLNGERVARVDGQYLGFDLPVNAWLRDGRNSLGIRLDNRYRRHQLPGIRMPDFLLHGGLAGAVRLCGLPRVHMIADKTWVYCRNVMTDHADVIIPSALHNVSGRARTVDVAWTIRNSAGKVVAQAASPALWLDNAASVPCVVTVPLPRPRLWSPDIPTLYTAVGEVREGETVLDKHRLHFGCRQAEFRPGAGFFLNDERLELHGCNRHESMPGFGNAMPAAIDRADARLLKQTGCNFVRLSHYPQSPSFMDACDEFGLLVYAELASWKSVRTGGWQRAAQRQLQALIARDRHRPSVILWGLGNESRSRRAYTALRDLAGTLDPTRPVIYAENHLYRARRQRTLGLTDVWGCNYELDELEAGRDASRQQCVIVSECSNYPPATRGDLDAEAAQADLVASDLARFRALPYVAGFTLWCWSDYATMRKERFARHCGIVDAWRLPKLAAGLMQAMFREEPYLHLRGDWGMAGGPTLRTVHVFSNCPAIELRLDGRVLQTLRGGPHWRVALPHEPLALTAEGVADGRMVFDSLPAHGVATRLEVHGDALAGDPAHSGVLSIRVRAVDAAGHVDLNWRGWAQLAVSGGGTPIAHTPEHRVPLSAGEGRAFVRLLRGGVAVGVTVSAEGVEPAQLQYPV
ncbi:MAG: glycoside hydrolase family 2 protein [Lentisphaerae bacterium]|nr:glycoside hydrolase family 2 protein [Lentisphaerota bacterium]